jgi:hypothetical protein
MTPQAWSGATTTGTTGCRCVASGISTTPKLRDLEGF